VFESQLLGSFSKNLLLPLTENDNIDEKQIRNCMHSKSVCATPLELTMR